MKINKTIFIIVLILLASCQLSDDSIGVLTKGRLDELLQESMSKNTNIPGSLALVETPNLNWSNATGLSSVESALSMRVDNKFVISSLTKSMTAVIILQLMEENKLNLDDFVSNWISIETLDKLTNFNNKTYGNQVTIKHLLNHTSGIFDYLNNGEVHINAYQNAPGLRYSLLDRINLAIDQGTPYNKPGDEFNYSNTNYVLLGMLIEIITQDNLSNQFKNRIFTPLNMESSFLTPNQGEVSDLAQGYFQDINITSFIYNFNYGSSEGGVISTLSDLKLFIKGLVNGTLFNEESTLEFMLSFENYGYGLGIRAFSTKEPYGKIWGHDGADPGYFCYAIYIEKEDAIVIYAANRSEIEVLEPAFFINAVINELVN